MKNRANNWQRPRFGSRGFFPTLIAVLLVLPFVAARAHATGELGDYLARPDSSYGWHEVQSGPLGSASYIGVILTSQTWRGIPWTHQLFIIRPAKMDPNVRQAFLYIDGGRWNPKYAEGPTQLPATSRMIFTNLANSLHAPVAVVRQVPFQPLFDRREDALIAYTFDRFLSTGDTDWPLLLPMVKSAVRAMDAVQEITAQRWNLHIERFTVSGASKRGWTSWLTAASDPRVASVAPMVIAMLNMPAQIRLQRATFGGLSAQVRDYEDIDLPDRIDSETGRRLISMVDPYSYRASLTQPKLILLGTNDAYWPLDALHVYWKDLPDPKRVLYLPNQGHSLRDADRLIGTLSAFHRYSARGENLPDVGWKFSAEPGRIDLAVEPGRKPRRVIAWTASSPTRDFRTARWSRQDCKRADRRASHTEFICTQSAPSAGYTAIYSEVTFRDRGEDDFSLSTGVCIAGAPGDSQADAVLDGC
jgi:PhoPQ-activated pathogenicity-related protein